MKLLPLKLFLFLFLLDKLFLIPAVKNIFVQNLVNSYEMVHGLHVKKNLIFEEDFKKSGKTKKIYFIGTSRSENYGEVTDEEIKINPYIKNKEELLKWAVNSLFSIRAGSPLLLFGSADFFLKQNIPADIIVIETSFPTFNHQNKFVDRNQIYDMELKFFWDNLRFFTNSEIINYISAKVFVLNYFNVQWKSVFSKKNSLEEAEIKKMVDAITELKLMEEAKQKKNAKGTIVLIHPGDYQEFAEPSEHLKANKEYIQYLLQMFYSNYKGHHKKYMLMMEKIAIEGKARGIKVVFYKTPVHQSLTEATKGFRTQELIWEKEMQEIAQKHDAKFINLENESRVSCRYFRDVSHLSQVCFPEVIEIIIDATGNK